MVVGHDNHLLYGSKSDNDKQGNIDTDCNIMQIISNDRFTKDSKKKKRAH